MAEAHETLAPWAEIVPNTGPMTVDDLLTLPDGGWHYELVDGRLVRMAGSGQRATTIAAILLGALIAFVRPRRLGVVTGADGVYKCDPVRETGLIPDVGFYVAARQALIVDPNKRAAHAWCGWCGLIVSRSTRGMQGTPSHRQLAVSAIPSTGRTWSPASSILLPTSSCNSYREAPIHPTAAAVG
jgi:hypothetical protein